MRPSRQVGLLAGVAALASACALGGPADPFADVEITATHVGGAVHMLEGRGGNIGVSVGEDGVLIVDDQFMPLATRILAAIESLGGKAPRFVLNTHFHGDHTGSNPFFGRTGVVMAHDNVLARLASGDMPPVGLPMVTYRDRLRLRFNGDDVVVLHLPRGHTDGDSVVWFKESNVVHMGDHLFNGRFPFVDVANGGSVGGVLANLRRVVEMVPADAKVIPGHGPLATVADVAAAADMIEASRAMVREAVANGALDALKAKGLERWPGWGDGFISEARWIDTIVASDRAPD